MKGHTGTRDQRRLCWQQVVSVLSVVGGENGRASWPTVLHKLAIQDVIDDRAPRDSPGRNADSKGSWAGM